MRFLWLVPCQQQARLAQPLYLCFQTMTVLPLVSKFLQLQFWRQKRINCPSLNTKLKKWEQSQTETSRYSCLPYPCSEQRLMAQTTPGTFEVKSNSSRRCQRSLYLWHTWSPLLKSTQYHLLQDSVTSLEFDLFLKVFQVDLVEASHEKLSHTSPPAQVGAGSRAKTDIHCALDKLFCLMTIMKIPRIFGYFSMTEK